MRTVFADTFYRIALLNPKDQAHASAVSVSTGLGAARIVTTDEVLAEFLNYFGARGSFFRTAPATLVGRMHSDAMIQIAPQTRDSFIAGLRFYQARPDKGYSLTDCISMEVMHRGGLSQVLSND